MEPLMSLSQLDIEHNAKKDEIKKSHERRNNGFMCQLMIWEQMHTVMEQGINPATAMMESPRSLQIIWGCLQNENVCKMMALN